MCHTLFQVSVMNFVNFSVIFPLIQPTLLVLAMNMTKAWPTIVPHILPQSDWSEE